MSPHKKKASDEKIIRTLKKHNALVRIELEDLLGYSHESLGPRLHKLAAGGKIKSRTMPHRAQTGSYVIFRGYTDVTMYYVDDEDFIAWIRSKLPKKLPGNLRKIITMKLHEMGIDLNLSPRTKLMMIGIRPDIHYEIKKIANIEKKSMRDITDEALLSYIRLRKANEKNE